MTTTLTTVQQATRFVSSLNRLIKHESADGVSSGVIMTCLIRMAAAFAMDSGANSKEFAVIAEEEFGRVPLKRKLPDNVVPLPKKGM